MSRIFFAFAPPLPPPIFFPDGGTVLVAEVESSIALYGSDPLKVVGVPPNLKTVKRVRNWLKAG